MNLPELALRLGAWTISTLFVLCLTYLISKQLPLDRPSLQAIGFLIVAIYVTTLFLLVFGLLGLLNASALALTSGAGLSLMMAVPSSRRLLLELSSAGGEAGRKTTVFWASLPGWLRIVTIAGILLSVLRFAFLIWALPPFVWDSLTYHLTNVAHWTQAGRIELFPTPVLRIYTPAGYEVLATWFTVFLHHDAFVEAAGLPAYVLAILAVYAIGRSLGASRSAACLGAMGYASTPALLLATTGTKNDPHMAAYYLAGMALVLNLTVRRSKREPRTTASCLILLTMSIFLAAGTKAYIAHLLPGLVAVALLLPGARNTLQLWKERVAEAAKGWTLIGSWTRRSLMLLLIGAAFLGSYWNLRNWLLTGNPFFPYGVSIQGAQLFTGAERTSLLNTHRLAQNLVSLADKFGDRAGPVEPDLPATTGWGWFFYGLGLPALGLAVLRNRRMRVVLIGFAISLLTLLLSTRPSPYNARYLLWLPALGGIAFALNWDMLPVRPRVFIILVAALYSATLSLNLAMTLNYNRVSLDKFGLVLERPLWEREAALLKLNMPSEYEDAILIASRDETLGYNVGNDGFVYPLFRADFSQRLVYVPVRIGEDCRDIAVSMRALGTRYLFVAPGHSPEAVLQTVRQCSAPGGQLVERSRGLYAIAESP